MKKGWVILLSLCISTSAFAANMSRRDIENRIRPIGQVKVAKEQTTTSSEDTAKDNKTQLAANSGEKIYNQYCMACHTTGAAGAPKIGDQKEWGKRSKNGSQQGITTLYEHAIKGFNMMPPKGGCSKCTDSEVKAAVDYLLKKKSSDA